MLEKSFFEKIESSWERIKGCNKKVFIYGMGDGCEKILKICGEKNIVVDGIFASDNFVRGQDFKGFTVKKLCDIEAENDDFLVVLAFGTSLSEIMERIDDIEKSHEIIAPDTAVIGEGYFDKGYFLDNFDKAKSCYELLADDFSRETFINVTAFKISGKLSYLRKVFADADKASTVITLCDDEIYFDLGAYTGDTISEFVKRTDGRYRKIYAFEPDKHNFQKCVKNTISLDNTEIYNCAGWDKNTVLTFSDGAGRQAKLSDVGKKTDAKSVDAVLDGRECTYIKYDVEGADFEALDGSRKTIKAFAPKICCALYHRPYDYINIPIYINSIYPNYDFYIRQYPYYPAWETNLFCTKV